MGEMTDKAKGLANEAIGNARQAAGKVTDNASLHAKGVAQERKGEGQNLKGSIKGALADKISIARCSRPPRATQGRRLRRPFAFGWPGSGTSLQTFEMSRDGMIHR